MKKLHIEVHEIRIEFTSEISSFIPLILHGHLGLLGSALVATSGFPSVRFGVGAQNLGPPVFAVPHPISGAPPGSPFFCGAPSKDLAGGSKNGAPETAKTGPRKCGAPDGARGGVKKKDPPPRSVVRGGDFLRSPGKSGAPLAPKRTLGFPNAFQIL